MEFELVEDGQYIKHKTDLYKRLKSCTVPYKLNAEQKNRRRLYMREYRSKRKAPKCETTVAECAADKTIVTNS